MVDGATLAAHVQPDAGAAQHTSSSGQHEADDEEHTLVEEDSTGLRPTKLMTAASFLSTLQDSDSATDSGLSAATAPLEPKKVPPARPARSPKRDRRHHSKSPSIVFPSSPSASKKSGAKFALAGRPELFETRQSSTSSSSANSVQQSPELSSLTYMSSIASLTGSSPSAAVTPASDRSPRSASSPVSDGAQSFITAHQSSSATSTQRSSQVASPASTSVPSLSALAIVVDQSPIAQTGLGFLGRVSKQPLSFTSSSSSSAAASPTEQPGTELPQVDSVKQLVDNARRVSRSQSREFTYEEENNMSRRAQDGHDDGLGIFGVFDGLLSGRNGTPHSHSTSSLDSERQGYKAVSQSARPPTLKRENVPPRLGNSASRPAALVRRQSSTRTARRPRTPSSPITPPPIPPGLSPPCEAKSPFFTDAARDALNLPGDPPRSPRKAAARPTSPLGRQTGSTGGTKSLKRLSQVFGKSWSSPPGTSLSEFGETGISNKIHSNTRSAKTAPGDSQHPKIEIRRSESDDQVRPVVRARQTPSPRTQSSPLPARVASPYLLSPAGSSPGSFATLSPAMTAYSASPASTSVLSPSPSQSRTWRSTLSATDYDEAAKRFGMVEMRRQEVIWELCETELSFVESFKAVMEIFALPLRSHNGTWIKGVPVAVARLLDWASDIIYLHSEILKSVQAARANSPARPVVQSIAGAFMPFVSRFEDYQPYLVRFEKVTRLIDDLTSDKTSDFGEFLRIQNALPECCGLSLSSYLLKPVQRLMKYPLFFKQLLDFTPEEHPDRRETQSLLTKTDAIIRIMQEVKTREDEYDELKSIQARLRGLPNGFRLARRDRRLVWHGSLRRVHISDRDRILLDVDARATELSKIGEDGSAPVLFRSRPQSGLSTDSSSSDTKQDNFLAWASPVLPSESIKSAISTVSAGSSASNSDEPIMTERRGMTTRIGTMRPNGHVSQSTADGPIRMQVKRVVKTRAKETLSVVFVFSDLVILATKTGETTKWANKIGSTKRKSLSIAEDDGVYKVVEGLGVSRVLGLTDMSGKTEHDHLLKLDLLPISAGSERLTPLSLGSYHSLSTAAFFSLPTSASTPSPTNTFTRQSVSLEAPMSSIAATQWIQAFEQPCLYAYRSISPSALITTPITHMEHLSATLDATSLAASPQTDLVQLPALAARGRSPGEPYSAQLSSIEVGPSAPPVARPAPSNRDMDKAEADFWRARFEKVKRDMSGATGSLSIDVASRRGSGVPTLDKSSPPLPPGAAPRKSSTS